MKNACSLTAVAILLTLVTPFGQSQERTSEFYPLRVGNQWTYKVTAGDAPVQKVVITVDQQENYQYKFTQNNKEITESIVRFRLKTVSGSKELFEHVAVLADGVYRFTTAGKEITPPMCFLKLPLKAGVSWTVDSLSENVQLTGTFTCAEDTVKAAGGPQALRVSSKDFQLGTEKMTLDSWFAVNTGLVQQRVRIGNNEVLLELEAFKAAK